MPYTIVDRPEGQIVHTTYIHNFPVGEELQEMDKTLHAILETYNPADRIYLLSDMMEVDLTFPQLLQILSEVRQFNDAWYENAEMLIVGQGPLVEIATAAMGQDQYGNHPARFFASVEDAMTKIKPQG